MTVLLGSCHPSHPLLWSRHRVSAERAWIAVYTIPAREK
jgi:hypothetical protein